MQQFELQAQVRKAGKGGSHALRREGKIPAVFYGKGQENLDLSVNPRELERAISSEMGMNTIIKLKVAEKGEYPVLLRDYQAHLIKRNFTHADFQYLDLSKKIHLSVRIHLTGRAAGVKEGGILEQVARELHVSCLPTSIPKEISVDISELKVNQNLHLSDIKLPAGVESDEKTDVTIAAVIMPKDFIFQSL